jgi:hypothetical protein
VHGDEGEEFKEVREFRENDLKRRANEVRSSMEDAGLPNKLCIERVGLSNCRSKIIPVNSRFYL